MVVTEFPISMPVKLNRDGIDVPSYVPDGIYAIIAVYT